MVKNMDAIKYLQEWFCSQCNGDWEHNYGISISTIDNPGWSLKINLTDTDLYDRKFQEVSFFVQEKAQWYQCKVKAGFFEAACDPRSLSTVILIFLSWAGWSSEAISAK